MAEEMKNAQAAKVYETLCAALDAREWKYTKEEERLLVRFGVSGDDLPMDFVIVVDAERQLVRLMSLLNFKFKEEKRVEGAIATCAANFGMADGSFDYDITDGAVVFRMTESFRQSTLGEGFFQYMISCACAMVDGYNDKFLAISTGILSVQDFVKSL